MANYVQLDCALLRHPRWMTLTPTAKLYYIHMLAAAVEDSSPFLGRAQWTNGRAVQAVLGLPGFDAEAALAELAAPESHLIEDQGEKILLRGFKERYAELLRQREMNAARQRRHRERQKQGNDDVTPLLDVSNASVTDRLEEKKETRTKKKRTRTSTPSVRHDAAASAVHACPAELKDLELYANDEKLCAKWDTLMSGWKTAYEHLDIMAEVKKAHAWELANTKKKNRGRFLTNWLNRANDRPQRGGNGQWGKSKRDAATEKYQRSLEEMEKEFPA